MSWFKAGYPVERKQATAAVPIEKLCPECSLPTVAHTGYEQN